MKKPKIIVYHNIIKDKKIFIVVFIGQPLDFDRAKEVIKKYSSLVYSAIPTGINAITFVEKTDETSMHLPTTEEFMLGKLMLTTLPGRGELSHKEFKYLMKLYDLKKAIKFKVKEWYMKALEILYQYKQADEAFGNSYSMGERLEEAIKELEEYESDMDSYLDYTTGSRCTKSFNSSLGSIKNAYDRELEKIVKENI